MTEHYQNGYPSAIPFRSFTATVTPGDHYAMEAKLARTMNIRRHVEAAGGPTEFAASYGNGRWSQAQVSQWIAERSPKSIGGKLARAIEVELGLERGELDAWRGKAQQEDRPSEAQPIPVAVNQLENDIDALRYALAGIVAVMVDERPSEAARVAEAIKSQVPPHFAIRGYLRTLLRTLDGGHQSGNARHVARRRVKS